MSGPEVTHTDADDAATMAAEQRTGALADEVGGRHLRYRRAVETHLEHVQHELLALQATAYATDQLPDVTPLRASYRAVKEARDLYDAARDALRQHRSRN